MRRALTVRRLTSSASVPLRSQTPCGHPLIDVAGLKSNAAAEVDALRAALVKFGYFYVKGHDGISAEYLRSIYAYSKQAHALPPEVKHKYRQRGGTGVYSGPDIGQLELQYEADGIAARVCGWDYSRTRFSLGDGVADGDARYPTEDELSPHYPKVLDDCYERQNALAHILLGGFEQALALPANTLRDMFVGGSERGDFGTIRLLHYPGHGEGGEGGAAAAAADTTGIGAHTDFECFTLMHQNAPGLQLMPRCGEGHGEWMDAPVRPGEFVVILGDMLERLTNGHLLATPHRVLPTAHARDSIIRFNAFSPSTLIAPLAPFVTDERPLAYSPVRMDVHMETTMTNLAEGLGSWDRERQRSRSATHVYGGEWYALPVARAGGVAEAA